MTRNLRLTVFLLTGAGSCTGRSYQNTSPLREAQDLVSRFVALDTMGQPDSALGLIWKERCEVLPSTDFDAPVSQARILSATARGDTVLVSTEYHVLGRLTTYSASPKGERGSWRYLFRAAPQTDTIVYQVVRDASGKLRLDCGPYAANHPGPSRLAQVQQLMDDSSRVLWEAAVRAQNVPR
jgi:hypothetical protein